MANSRKSQPVFQFHIELREIKPKIWRRIQVENMTLDQFHECIQTAMGWSNSHLHVFEIEGERYSDPDSYNDGWDDDVDEEHNTHLITLEALLIRASKGYRFRYTYDFGDSWEHWVTFEGTLPRQPKTKYPLCLDGARACPPEDCGGTPGYEQLIETLANPKHPDHRSSRQWAGDYDPRAFSREETTASMQQGVPDWGTGEE